MEILQASVKDAKDILDLQKEAFKIEADLYNNYNITPLKEIIDEIQSAFANHVFLKAVDNNKIIGTVRAFEKDGTCYIGRLAVIPKMQNQGIGMLLMQNIETFFKTNRFELFVGSKSEKNIYLYKKLGYSIFKKEKYGCGGIEVFFMEKLI